MFMKSFSMMLARSIVLGSFLTTLISATAAPQISKNPSNVIAIADFPAGGSQKFSGFVTFMVVKGLVNVHVDVAGLPENSGPFVYHIHEKSLPGSLDCELAGLHLNPYNAPELCDAQLDNSYCQVGDLSGKHGFINTTCFETTYVDPYLALSKNSKASILNKSIVFHYANLTKLACANIEVATPERVGVLVKDYTEHNPEQLAVLKAILEDSDKDTAAVEVDDNLDLVEWDEESGLNVTKPVDNHHYHNYTNVSSYGNHSNFTGQVDDDCGEENNALTLSFGLPVLLAGVLGLVI